jgi:hypothetical protein
MRDVSFEVDQSLAFPLIDRSSKFGDYLVAEGHDTGGMAFVHNIRTGTDFFCSWYGDSDIVGLVGQRDEFPRVSPRIFFKHKRLE